MGQGGGGDERNESAQVAHEFLVTRRDGFELGLGPLAVKGDFHVGGQVLARDGVEALFHEHGEDRLGQGQGVGIETEQNEVARLVRLGSGGGKTPPEGPGIFFEFFFAKHVYPVLIVVTDLWPTG